MIINNIHLKSFRNHADRSFTFAPGLNLICGENGVGKTNILEAIHLIATSKSHRGAREREMIEYNKPCSGVALKYFAQERDQTLSVTLEHNAKRHFCHNNVAIKRTSDLLGLLNIVIFTPDDLQLIKGLPGLRRRFLDLTICQAKPKYFSALSSYNRVVYQKNELLKREADSDTLEIWNEQLADYGATVAEYRRDFLRYLAAITADKFSEVVNHKLSLRYINNYTDDAKINNPTSIAKASLEPRDKESVKQDILSAINRHAKKERRYKMSIIGVHRDDFSFAMDNKPAKAFCSQGQQRTIVICTKLATVMWLDMCAKDKPILLLDDVFSELDDNRQHYILQNIEGMQTIVTSTTDNIVKEYAKCIYI
ncbi:MAG: DNA replication/repair protein RecF [Clostridiales bacterium]|jgi:DNA replication and repair protein RecF|nr:DNA replication/repair protein RecF [Clostridiales bacterium]